MKSYNQGQEFVSFMNTDAMFNSIDNEYQSIPCQSLSISRVVEQTSTSAPRYKEEANQYSEMLDGAYQKSSFKNKVGKLKKYADFKAKRKLPMLIV